MKKVLIVDDTQMHIEAAKKQFAGNGEYGIMMASSFEEASQLIGKEHFDIAMTDVMMPAPKDGLGREEAKKYSGESMPMGLLVALLALSNDVEKVFLVSDMNHHAHPVAWALDAFPIWGENKVTVSSKMTLVEKGSYERVVVPELSRSTSGGWMKVTDTDKSEERKVFEKRRGDGDFVYVKNWLGTLVGEEKRGGENEV